MGGEEEMAPEEDLGGEEDTALLAAPPAKRDDGYVYHRDGSHTSPRGKGHVYTPVSVERGWDNRPAGARSRHWGSWGAIEMGKLPRRQIIPGGSELFSLGKGIPENVDTNYKDEERKLFEVTKEIKDLIKELEIRDEVKT